jgi:hypothetical protein
MRLSVPVPALALLVPALVMRAERITVPLDGAWQIADSVAAEPAPAEFAHTVPFQLRMKIPARPGQCLLKATAQPGHRPPTVSRRKVEIKGT